MSPVRPGSRSQLGTISSVKSGPVHYIDRILRNECMNLRRDHQSEPDQWIDDASDPEDQNINPERRARLAEAALHLEECAAHLTPDEYRVYEAIFLDQAKYEEFVQLSGVPMGTVSTSVRRVRKKLASCLEQKGFRVADLC